LALAWSSSVQVMEKQPASASPACVDVVVYRLEMEMDLVSQQVLDWLVVSAFDDPDAARTQLDLA
jgi:hypothetical protein